MHFTREPIIETIISPKEGCKLLLRNSRGEQTEEHYVDAVEVVSFGKAFFFRSIEKPKAFLLPVSDYEILEVKEPRLTLKTAPLERQNIKIGGGKEVRPKAEPMEEQEEESAEPSSSEEPVEATTPHSDRRRDRRRRRHRRSSEHAEWTPRKPESSAADTEGAEAPATQEEPLKMPSLIPPPTTLISQTLSRYKPKESSEAPEEKKETGGDAVVQRNATTEDPMLSSTYFLPVESDRDFYSF